MKKFILLSLAFASSYMLKAQTPNWSQDVAPILYSNCTKCHNPNGIAPFSLLTYTESYNTAPAIKAAVSSHYMPPWPPDPSYRHLAHERVLTTSQIQTIVDWVNAGAPSGDTLESPPQPVYSSASEIPNPDFTGVIPTYTVNATNDVYRCFVIPSGLATQKYITKLEVIPGDRSIVHHVLVYEDTSSKPTQLDNADPGPGYTNFGGTGSSASSLIGAWVPGSSTYQLPTGMGILLHANTKIILQIHYPAGTINKVDSTRINMILSDGPMRKVSITPVLNHYFLENGPLSIPAGTIKTFTAHYNVPLDYTLLSIGPHMHLVGQSISSWAVIPSVGTVPLISVPKWDFHWQGSYEFQTLVKVPAGTVLHSSATYDNTTANPENPNSPPQLVRVGESTTDEMMLVYFAYTPYQAGDENIVQDSGLFTGLDQSPGSKPTSLLLDPYPNPFTTQFDIRFYLAESESISLSVYDVSGRLVSAIANEGNRFSAGMHTIPFNINDLRDGIYILQMKTKEGVYTRRLVKT